jgi:predicted ATPase
LTAEVGSAFQQILVLKNESFYTEKQIPILSETVLSSKTQYPIPKKMQLAINVKQQAIEINMSTFSERLQGKITSVSIRGFRSLDRIDELALPQLTVLIGANGSGKSNFIRFFEMLGWMFRSQKLQEYIARSGGGDDQLFMGAKRTPRLEAQITIETDAGKNDYRFSLTHIPPDSLLLVDEAYRYSSNAFSTANENWTVLPMPSHEAVMVQQAVEDKTARIIVNLLKNCTTYQFHDTSAAANIKQKWDISDNAYLRSDGANLAPVLYRLQQNEVQRYKLITRQIARVLPGFSDFELQPDYGKIGLRWNGKHGAKSFGAHLTSDGSLRLFCLITLLNLADHMLPDILFLDEPELGLHPHAIGLVAQMIRKVAIARQVFIATQSPIMVDCFQLDNIIVADTKEGATQLRTLDQDTYRHWLEDDYQLSDLWLKEPIGSPR